MIGDGLFKGNGGFYHDKMLARHIQSGANKTRQRRGTRRPCPAGCGRMNHVADLVCKCGAEMRTKGVTTKTRWNSKGGA
jgi:hypothetical protein